jgi:hypothetical protein
MSEKLEVGIEYKALGFKITLSEEGSLNIRSTDTQNSLIVIPKTSNNIIIESWKYSPK